MASVVSIKVVLDNDGVPEKVSQIESSLDNLGTRGTASMRNLTAGVEAASGSMERLGGHTTTSLDSVRLLSQEFGLRIPRALESMLSRMPAVSGALGGIVAGLGAIAAAEVFVHVAEEAYHFYQSVLDVNGAFDKYLEKAKEAQFLKFMDPGSVAAAAMNLQQINDDIDRLNQKAATGGILGPIIGNHDLYTTKDEEQRTKDLGAKNALLANSQNYELADLDQGTAAMEKYAAATMGAVGAAKQLYDLRIDANRQKLLHGGFGDAGTGSSDKLLNADLDAQMEYFAKLSEIGKREAHEVADARAEALAAGLRGEARYAAELEHNADNITAKVRDGELTKRAAYLETQALRLKYDNEQLARLQALDEETDRKTRQGQSAGLTGAARILADSESEIAGTNQAEAKAYPAGTEPAQAALDYQNQRVAATAAANAKINELMDSFQQNVTLMADRALDGQLGGFERIDAEAKRAHDALQKTFAKDFDNAGMTDEQAMAQSADKRRGDDAIDAEAAQKRRTLQQQNAAEDLAMAREASQAESRVRGNGLTGWLADYKEAISSIQDQEAQRLVKLDEDAVKEGLTWQEVAQRRVDIERTAAAQIAEQNAQMQHTIAGDLQSAFTDPMRFIKEQGEKMMFEMIAKWLMQLSLFKNAYSAIMGGIQPGGATGSTGGTAAGSGLSGLFNGIHPIGTAGVVRGGTMLPNGYNDSQLSGSSGGGSSSTIASPGSGAYGGTTSTISSAGSVFSDASSLASRFGLTSKQASAAGDPSSSASSGSSTFDWNDPTDPEAQASAQTTAAMQSTAGGPTAASALSSTLGMAGAAFAGYQGAEGVLKNFHEGGVNGAMSGTMDGAALGASIGSIVPGLGTVIGGVAGAAAGLATNLIGDALGESGRFAARDYYKNTLFPELEALRNSTGGSDYLSQVSEANRDAATGKLYMSQKWGQDASAWVASNYLNKELNDVVTLITRRAGSGSQYIGASAKQFHGGGQIAGFGSLATSSTEGYIHALMHEGIVNEPAMARHGSAVGMMNNGASPADMASHYLKMSGSGGTVGGGGTVHQHSWTVHALDTQSFEDFLDRGANKSVDRSMNRLTAAYGGDGQL